MQTVEPPGTSQLETACEILDSAQYCHLATASPQGEPEVRPLNYARVGEVIYVHCAADGTLQERSGGAAVLSAVDTAAWLPSYWRDPEMACPASTWYRSVQVRGRLQEVTSPAEKAEALNALMRRCQPEGGCVPITPDGRYLGPLRAVTVLSLPLREFVCRVKVGQHLTPEVRGRMATRLEERGTPDDLKLRSLLSRYNADVPWPYPCVDVDGLRWVDDAARIPPDDLRGLLAQTFWAADRPLAVVIENLRRSTLTLAAFEGERLVAHARACVVHPKVAWLFDVVVDRSLRGQGLGSRLMSRVLDHPRVRRILRVFLDTRDAMSLYARFGFVELQGTESPNRTLMVLERRQAPRGPSPDGAGPTVVETA